MSAQRPLEAANGCTQRRVFCTGAFEIWLDGKELHSKLATGGVPHIRSLIEQLREAGIPTYEDMAKLEG